MNRPLKFKVWNKKSNEWCGTIGLNETIPHNSISYLPDDLVFVQYTGLKDSKDKEIYEGDILQSIITNTFYQVKHGWYRQYEELELENGKIHTFNYAHVGFFVEYNENGEACEGTLAIRNSNSVVVGNIFEHKHLLEK